jgi:hypothetical protein
MNLDDLNNFWVTANQIYQRLHEFRPLIRKKHETFTYQAFDTAMSDLHRLFNELHDALKELPSIKAEMGDDALVNLDTGIITPFRKKGQRNDQPNT